MSLSHSICSGDRVSMVPRVMSSSSPSLCVVGLSGGVWLLFGGGSSFAGSVVWGMWPGGVNSALLFSFILLRFSFWARDWNPLIRLCTSPIVWA